MPLDSDTTNGALTRTTFGLPISTSPLLNLIYAPLQVIRLSSFAAIVTLPALLVNVASFSAFSCNSSFCACTVTAPWLACTLIPWLCANRFRPSAAWAVRLWPALMSVWLPLTRWMFSPAVCSWLCWVAVAMPAGAVWIKPASFRSLRASFRQPLWVASSVWWFFP